jgi:hypothetical protein
MGAVGAMALAALHRRLTCRWSSRL